MSRIIKVSFEARHTWDRGDFRQFMKLLKNTEDIQLYIIAETAAPEGDPLDPPLTDNYIDSIAEYLEIPGERVLVDNKFSDIEDESIDIHLDSIYADIVRIEDETETAVIFVKQEDNGQKVAPLWLSEFNDALTAVIDAEN